MIHCRLETLLGGEAAELWLCRKKEDFYHKCIVLIYVKQKHVESILQMCFRFIVWLENCVKKSTLILKWWIKLTTANSQMIAWLFWLINSLTASTNTKCLWVLHGHFSSLILSLTLWTLFFFLMFCGLPRLGEYCPWKRQKVGETGDVFSCWTDSVTYSVIMK